MTFDIAADQLKSIVQRVERLEEEIKSLNDDKSDIYNEARAFGFNVKAIKKVVSQRKLDSREREEADLVFDTYWNAVHGIGLVHAHAREKIEKFDPETGEILDAADERSDGGLNIVHKHTQIASASQGEAEAPSAEVSPAIIYQPDRLTGDIEASAANTGGDHVTVEPTAAISAGALTTRAPATRRLRPHCQRPDMCGSGTKDHCHSCQKAIQEKPEQVQSFLITPGEESEPETAEVATAISGGADASKVIRPAASDTRENFEVVA